MSIDYPKTRGQIGMCIQDGIQVSSRPWVVSSGAMSAVVFRWRHSHSSVEGQEPIYCIRIRQSTSSKGVFSRLTGSHFSRKFPALYIREVRYCSKMTILQGRGPVVSHLAEVLSFVEVRSGRKWKSYRPDSWIRTNGFRGYWMCMKGIFKHCNGDNVLVCCQINVMIFRRERGVAT